MTHMSDKPDVSTKPSFFQVLGSVAAAAFGVQSSANRERDFRSGSVRVYVLASVGFTIVFVVSIIAVVRAVLA
jgi:hypothetical protein